VGLIVASFYINVSEAKAPLETHNFSEVSVSQSIEQIITPQEYLKNRLQQEGLSLLYEVFYNIAWCESGWQTKVISPTNDVGIFQINLTAHGRSVEYWQDPYENIEYALELYKKNGFKDWVMSEHCWYESLKTNTET